MELNVGQFWLHDIDTVLHEGIGKGIPTITTIHGWETRSRSSGGLDSINGVLDHHTSSSEASDWDNDIEYIAFGNPYAPSPISQLYLGRTGAVAIIAAGAANHGGAGGSYIPGGEMFVSVNGANRQLIGKEMGNNGVGEQWPWEQIMSSITVDALICLAEKFGPSRVFAHKEYCGPGTTTPGRKPDPFGPWENHPNKYWNDGSSWGPTQGNIGYYRTLVGKRMFELSQEINLMHGFVPKSETQKARILDTRGGGDIYKVKPMSSIPVNIPGGVGKSHVIVNVTITEPEDVGFMILWAGGEVPTESKINWVKGQTIANEVTIPLAADGTVRMWSRARTHVIFDLVGYYQKM